MADASAVCTQVESADVFAKIMTVRIGSRRTGRRAMKSRSSMRLATGAILSGCAIWPTVTGVIG